MKVILISAVCVIGLFECREVGVAFFFLLSTSSGSIIPGVYLNSENYFIGMLMHRQSWISGDSTLINNS